MSRGQRRRRWRQVKGVERPQAPSASGPTPACMPSVTAARAPHCARRGNAPSRRRRVRPLWRWTIAPAISRKLEGRAQPWEIVRGNQSGTQSGTHEWQSPAISRARVGPHRAAVGTLSHVPLARGPWSSPDEGGHQRSSEVIRGHQRSSEVIRGHHLLQVRLE